MTFILIFIVSIYLLARSDSLVQLELSFQDSEFFGFFWHKNYDIKLAGQMGYVIMSSLFLCINNLYLLAILYHLLY